MLSLRECIDLSGLGAKRAKALSKRATLPEVAAAQAARPRKVPPRHRPAANDATNDDAVEADLLEKVHAARDFAELKAVLDRYCAFARHLHRS